MEINKEFDNNHNVYKNVGYTIIKVNEVNNPNQTTNQNLFEL